MIQRGGRVLLRQCQPDERWAGLWDYPRFRIDPGQASTSDLHRALVHGVRRQVGIDVRMEHQFMRWRHGVTRYDITLLCFRAEFLATKTRRPGAVPTRWLWVSQLDRYPQSVTARRISESLVAPSVP